MYENILVAHSWLRWGVVVFGVLALLMALGGIFTGQKRGGAHKLVGLLTIICVDIQLLLGLLLHFGLSPLTKNALKDMGGAMKDPTMRFWAVEHGVSMLLALVFFHVGKVWSKKAEHDRAGHTRLFLMFLIALVLIYARAPWDFTDGMHPVQRPWLRMPG